MKNWLIGALVVALVSATVPSVSEAKRLAGGKSTGLKRDMPARTAPDAPPAKPATPQQGAANPAAPATAGAAPAAAAPKRSWMGPLAGLAAGLGIAALMSHLGMGEAFGNFLMMALLGVAAVFLVMFLLRRFGPQSRTPALAAGTASGHAAAGGQVAWPSATPAAPATADSATTERRAMNGPTSVASPSAAQLPPGTAASTDLPTAETGAPATAAAVAKVFVPASFDSEGFARTAKLIFIRMQAANDTADLDDLRRFTTPELFASLRLDLQERGASAQHTDVVKVLAEVLDVSNETDRQVVSVRFHGDMIEEKGAAAAPFNEVWHLVKPHDDSQSWAVAGIEQMG
jgi:predicted lipid-binding transport protein (Tim44 family)